MSRKFSDSEIRAYTKNRYEEKLLREKLEKLKENISIFHDAAAKQKQDLVTECKEIRMTSGGSPIPAGLEIDEEFDISKRVSRPWAYSVMDTTYNAVYRDAVIPLPKKHHEKSRPKSETSRGLTSRSSMYLNRIMSSKSHASTIKSNFTTQSDNMLNSRRLVPVSVGRSVSDLEISSSRPKSDPVVHFRFTKERKDGMIQKGEAIFENGKYEENITEHHSAAEDNYNVEVSPHQVEITEITEHNEYAYKPLPEPKHVTTVISLPPMYKIDSKEYQAAERERTLKRSRSRVSLSNYVGMNETHDKTKSAPTPKRVSSDPRTVENSVERESVPGENVTQENDSNHDNIDHNENKSKTLLTIDPESFDDVRVRHFDEVIYRGRKLKNYIRPEDRYKLDPLVMKRRQNKMDKLAKESATFLKRVNHENIKVEIAFPRSARKRILNKLVKENNSGNCKTVKDDSGPMIRRKIEDFMHSMSEYLHQQHIAHEHYPL